MMKVISSDCALLSPFFSWAILTVGACGKGFRFLFRLTSSANEYLISSSDKNTWILGINNGKKDLRIRSGMIYDLNEITKVVQNKVLIDLRC